MKTGLLVLIIFCSLASGCMSQRNLHEGMVSFQAEDYRRAFIRLMPEAEKGQPDAQYAIGYMYYYGQGVVENRGKARVWILRAARAGQPDAIKAVPLVMRRRGF